jgi:cyanophycin synthetase
MKRIVVKPENKGLGKDVYLETNEESITRAAAFILEKYKKRGLMQEFVPGHDLRIQVIGGKFFAACRRIPANVRGNGIHTIRQLIEFKNLEKSKYKAKNLILVTDETQALLEEQGLHMDAIPESNRAIQLRKAANIGIGGDPLDVTHQVHHEYHSVAERISEVYGAKNFAMDFVTEDESKPISKGASSLLEINAPSMWGLHHFAMGTKRNVALAILDAHFHTQKFNPRDVKYIIQETNDHRAIRTPEVPTPYSPHSVLSS